MDLKAEFEQLVEEMEWEDVFHTLQAVVDEILGGTVNAPPSTSLPPALPAGLGFPTYPQPLSLSERNVSCTLHHVGAPPYGFDRLMLADHELNGGKPAAIRFQQPLLDQRAMQFGHLYSQAGAYSQSQYLYPLAVHSFPGTSTVTTYPAVPPHAYNTVPTVRSLEAMGQNLVPVGVLNGNVVYQVVADRVAPSNCAAPSPRTSVSKKRKRTDQQHDDQPYIKKPPNAFMLFRKEQRPNVVAELNITDCAAVNTILGQRWKMLSKEEQAKYYEEAKKESLLHAQRYPGWSAGDNYGKKRKRKRCKSPITADTTTERGEESSTLAHMCDADFHLAHCPSDGGSSHTDKMTGMGPSTSQTVLVKQPHVEAPVLLPV